MSRIIGIDLGTSTSEVAVFEDNKPVIISGPEGETIIPSVVGLDEEGNIIVGIKAEDQLLLRQEYTVAEVKRLMGSEQMIKLGKKEYSPIWVSGQILSYIRRIASEYLKEDVTRAVITVPAYFNELQRQATVEAGKLAGFQVERIINEPTAAALCYGIEHMEEESHILVYDLGGGTFDVTLLEMFNGVLEVKASSGDNQLGGADFDRTIMDYLTQAFEKKEGINLRKDIYAMVKLKAAAQACKIALSSQSSYEVVIPFITQKGGLPLSLQETVTVEIFEGLITELLERTKKPIEIVLADSRIPADKIDLIILAGGSTRIPYVRRYIRELLGKEPSQAIHPELSIALGAAIQAGILNDDISQEEGIILTDVNPYALGVRAYIHEGGFLNDNYMDIIIPRNVTIPVTKTKIFTTAVDFQSDAIVEVYQGDKEEATSNNFLGKFVLTDIPLGKAGKEKLEVRFSYDMNGMLQVEGTIVSTGDTSVIHIDMNGNASSKTVDVTKWKEANLAIKFRSTIRKAEKLLKQELNGVDRLDIEELIYELKKALLTNIEEEDIVNIEDELLEIMEELDN